MSTATIGPVVALERAPADLTALRASHLALAADVAELDLDDARMWESADAIVAGIAAEANAMTTLLTGQPTPPTAAIAPPIARVRELAVAQRRMLAAMDQTTNDHDEVGRSLHRLGLLVRRVRSLAGST